MPYVFEDEQDYLTQLAPDAPAASRFVFEDEETAAPSKEGPSTKDYAEDVAKSVIYRGVPEALMASTLLGYGTNIVRGMSDLTRWASGKAYKGIYGEDLPHYTSNPIPYSSDILRFASGEALGEDLYEPRTVPGQYANTAAQFGTGGAILGAPLRATLPAAVASETAGQLTKGTDWETPARLAGAMVAPALLSRAGSGPRQVKSSDQVRTSASALFKQAEKEGGLIPAKSTDAWINHSSKILPQTEAGKLVLGENSATQLMGRIEGLKGKPLTLTAAQEIDSGLGKLINKEVDVKTGKLSAEGVEIRRIQQSLRDVVDEMPDQGFSTLKQAKSEWGKQARMADIERIIERASDMDNPAVGLKTGFRNLKNNKAQFNKFNDAEKAAIRHAAKTGIVTGALRIGGSRLISGIVGAAGGAAGGGVPGAILGTMAGEAAAFPMRALATSRQMSRANSALEAVANRGLPPTKSALLELLEQQTPAFQGIPIRPKAATPVRSN